MAKGLPRVAKNSAFAVPGDFGRVTIPVRNFPLSVSAAGAAVGFGTAVIGDFPAGNILMLGAVGYFRFTTASANITLATYIATFSVGTAPTVAGALTTNEADIISSTAASAAVAKVTPYTRSLTVAAGDLSTYPKIFDNQGAGALEVNLNLLIAAADITDSSTAAFTVDGVLHMAYVMLGNS